MAYIHRLKIEIRDSLSKTDRVYVPCPDPKKPDYVRVKLKRGCNGCKHYAGLNWDEVYCAHNEVTTAIRLAPEKGLETRIATFVAYGGGLALLKQSMANEDQAEVERLFNKYKGKINAQVQPARR